MLSAHSVSSFIEDVCVDVINFFGGNLDFPKIEKWKKVCSDV